MLRRNIFVLGKGGVGKTTLSLLMALYFSSEYDIGLYSFDPAHNLFDLLESKSLNKNLYIEEVDFEKWKKKYLQQLRHSLKSSYSYLSAYNLLQYFDIFEQAPDSDNLGMILAYEHILTKNKHNFLIFDMPPTAVALEFFRTIRRNRRWIEVLSDLRQRILNKKEVISVIKFGKKKIETDKVMARLKSMQKFYTTLEKAIEDSYFFIIRNPDNLSHKEGDRIKSALENLDINKITFIDNKIETSVSERVLRKFDEKTNIVRSFDKILTKNKRLFIELEEILELKFTDKQ